MSNSRDHNSKNRRNDHPLKSLPTEVLLRARSTLVSLGGALKPRQEQPQQRPKMFKQEPKEKKKHDRLKNSRSEPEFSEIRKSKHRSRIDESLPREYTGNRPRPLSVGAIKQYDKQIDEFQSGNLSKEMSPLHQRAYDFTEEACVQSRLVIPVIERLSNHDIQSQDVNERPRKKLSFREPEIITSGSATVGRSHKLMGINSLTQKNNRVPVRSEMHSSSLERLDSDLESQAMRIVRTVGQAFEVCHKMQNNSPDQPVPSTSSTADEPTPSDRVSDVPISKEVASDCGASESGAASTSKVPVEEKPTERGEDHTRPKHLDLLPPPPRKDSRRSPQRTPAPSINLPDLPECVTKVEVTASGAEGANDATTPLSAQHQLQLLRERLEQQAQQTRAAVAQLLLLRDQLAAEQAARCEAQARTHQLLVHNKELLEHIAALVAHLQERERGSSRPISAQQLTLLPQTKTGNELNNLIRTENHHRQLNTDAFVNLIAQTNKVSQNVENNNIRLYPFCVSPVLPGTPANGPSSAPCFGGMTNEQIQNYLITKFQTMGGFTNDVTEAKANNSNNNQQFYQNCTAFPNIPPLTNHYNNTNIANLVNNKTYLEGCSSNDELGALIQAMSVGQSQNSLYSTSQPTTSKDSTPEALSSDDGVPFIMPLSHNGTLTATGEDGRVRLIVPVSPSESATDVAELQNETQAPFGNTLKVPVADRSLAPGAPITRSTSEKVPNRSEMMTALRSQWTRHTTK